MSKDNTTAERQPTMDEIVWSVTAKCDSYLINTFGIGWNDLADNTCVEDFVCEDFYSNDTETQEHIVKDICWDKLDLDETIYNAMTPQQLNVIIYGEDA